MAEGKGESEREEKSDTNSLAAPISKPIENARQAQDSESKGATNHWSPEPYKTALRKIVALLSYDRVINGLNALSTVVIAIVTVVGGFLVYWQLDETKKSNELTRQALGDARKARTEDNEAASADRATAQENFGKTLGEMKRSNDLTRDSFTEAHELAVATRRARVIFSAVTVKDVGPAKNLRAIARMKNLGINTAITAGEQYCRLFVRHEKLLTFTPTKVKVLPPITLVVAGGESYELPSDWYYLSAEDYGMVIKGDATLYAQAYITYADEFGTWGTEQLWFFQKDMQTFFMAPFGNSIR